MVTIKKRGQNLSALLLISCVLILLTACGPAGPRNVIKGEKLLRKGDVQGAIEKLELANQQLAKDPAPVRAQALNFLGLAYHDAGEPQKALKAYQEAHTLDRNLVEADYNMGVLLLEQKNYPAAVDWLTTYTTLSPKDPDGFIKLGTAHLHWSTHVNTAEKSRHLEAARKNFEASRLITPTAEAANALGVVHLQRNRPTEAQKEFRNAVQIDPNYAPAVLNLAIVAHQYQHDHRLALQKYRDYLALKPTPENAKEIEVVVKSLEREFAPPPAAIAATPKPTPPVNNTPTPKPTAAPVASTVVKTNAPVPTVVQTPAPRPASAPLSSPKAQPDTTTRPVSAPTIAVTPKPASDSVEVAQLNDTAAPKVAQDISTPAPKPAMPAVSAPRPIALQPLEPKPEKKSILKKLNPVTWFGKKNKTKEAPEPVPEPAKETSLPETKPAVAVVAPAAPVTAEPTPVAAKPTIARYNYTSPAKPNAGNTQAAEKFVVQGDSARRNAHFQDAIAAYRNALVTDPANFNAAYMLALTEQDLSDFTSSLPHLEQALAIRPESTDARYAFAWALYKCRYPQDAANELEKALQQSPNSAKAHLLLATVYSQSLSQPNLARDHYRRVLELDPRNSQATAIRFWLAANP